MSASNSLSSLDENQQESLKKMTVASKDPRLKLEPMPRRCVIVGNDDDLSENEEYYLTEIEIMNNADLMGKIVRDEKLIWEEICQVETQLRSKKKPNRLKGGNKQKSFKFPRSHCSKVSISKYSNKNVTALRKESSGVMSNSSSNTLYS